MTTKRKHIKRLTIPLLKSKLASDFGIVVETKETHTNLVQMYMQNWVNKVEESLK